MKYSFLGILSLFLSYQSWALEAVVLAPKISLFLQESDQAEISEYRTQGSLIFIHGHYNTHSTTNQFVNNDFEQIKFYKSIDRIGRIVYVKAQDVFIYYGDTRELEQLE